MEGGCQGGREGEQVCDRREREEEQKWGVTRKDKGVTEEESGCQG